MTIQQLQNEMQDLRSLLTSENYSETVKKMRSIDKQITALRASQLLNGVNGKQTRLREAAALAWECEQPTEDITTNGGCFHKVKVKKYPKLEALKYTSATFKGNLLVRLTINGEKFDMYKTEYKTGEPETYSRPESFAEFLKLNQIAPEDITAEKFTEIGIKIKEANEELRKQIEAYGKKMDALNAYKLECCNLISKKAEYVYLYNTNS